MIRILLGSSLWRFSVQMGEDPGVNTELAGVSINPIRPGKASGSPRRSWKYFNNCTLSLETTYFEMSSLPETQALQKLNDARVSLPSDK